MANMIRSNPPAVKRNPVGESGTGFTLDTPVQALKGVGPKRLALFKRLGLSTIRDLVYHLPRRHEDRRTFLPIAQLTHLQEGQKATVRGRVASCSIFRAKTGTVIVSVAVKDATGTITALWFNQPWMKRWFPLGQELILYGAPARVGKKIQMAVPEFEILQADPEEPGGKPAAKSLHMGRIVPIYPATSGLHQRTLREAAAEALLGLRHRIEDPLPEGIRRKHSLLDLQAALERIHFPPVPEAIEKAKERLTFEELLCFHLALGLRRRTLEARPGIRHRTGGDLVDRWRGSLPFTLTPGQEKAVEAIAADMGSSTPMHRLLQGEVGSGKTVVAAYAIAVAVQNRFQAAVLAPTEVLARQHALTLSQLFAPIGVPVSLLISGQEESARLDLLRDLQTGKTPVIVGTHALLEPGVAFQKLGLVVIDEQQKFGVEQRNFLVGKGKNPDLLILTATPIPRTLALTLYGEMDVTTLTEKPRGRPPVRTVWMDSTRREEVYAFVRKELEEGRQAYVVCPRIGADQPAANSAVAMFKEYQEIFSGWKVGLLHGRMATPEQKQIFSAFKGGQIQVLVATQIIEVGVDVPNAAVMVIEGAERFGLSQLHQLRGRVGRGRHESTCILMADPKAPEERERLQKLVDLEDAFRIAEEDLRMRGPGELLGKKQAGLPDLKCLTWATHGPWLEKTKVEAESILSSDFDKSGPEISNLKGEMCIRFPKLVEGCA